MADLLQELGDRIGTLGGDWTKYTVVGSFLLYLLGYLALRFHLTAIGIGTDLAVLDERYLFTGARFLVYLVSSVPKIVAVALPLTALMWLVLKVLPATARAKTSTWFMQPGRLAVFGIVFTVVIIQSVMSQCFFFSDLLLASGLPAEPAWLVKLLLDDQLMPLFFSLLVAACAVPLAILLALRNFEPLSGAVAFAKRLLAFLATVQVLLLPINYGVLIVDKSLPRVAAIGDKPLADGEESWLVWEGKDGVTFLLRSKDSKQRRLLTVSRGDVKRTEIMGFDRILPKLFGAPSRGKQ
jgi:hypothetical protein